MSNLSMRRAALVSRLPKSTLRDAIKTNKLAGSRAGATGAWLIDGRDLHRFAKENAATVERDDARPNRKPFMREIGAGIK
jgi:hypothetical protein